MNSIPLVLLTGFLGSGKTTFVNRLLRLQGPHKLGVIVNEFGKVGIDGRLLGPGDIIEMGGGCVCCASGDELWESCLSLIERASVTHLLIETSGIAEVDVLIQQFQQTPSSVQDRLQLGHIICVVDALHLEAYLSRRSESQRQIQAATRIFISKTDLATPAQIENTHHLLDQLSATSERMLLFANQTQEDMSHAFSFIFSARNIALRTPTTTTHQKGQLRVFCIESASPMLRTPLTHLFEEISPSLLRAKGFISLWEEGHPTWHVLQLAGTKLTLEPASTERIASFPEKTTVVFIHEGIDESWVHARFLGCAAAPQKNEIMTPSKDDE